MQTKTLNKLNVDVDRLQTALSQTQRLAGIGTLTASVAHELTNPISIITTACNNLLSRVADDNLNTDELLYYLEMIDHSAWRAARLDLAGEMSTRGDGYTFQGRLTDVGCDEILPGDWKKRLEGRLDADFTVDAIGFFSGDVESS